MLLTNNITNMIYFTGILFGGIAFMITFAFQILARFCYGTYTYSILYMNMTLFYKIYQFRIFAFRV